MILSRRTLATSAAWVAPVVAVAVAAPGASASGGHVPDVGAYQLTGRCQGQSILPLSFVLTAGAVPLPAGTTVGLASTGAQTRYIRWEYIDGVAQWVRGPTTVFELTVDLAPGGSNTFRASHTVQTPFTFTGTVDPAGEAIGTGSTSTATVSTDIVGRCELS